MKTNKTKNITTIVFTALMAAMCCVATMVIRLPSPMGGYLNLGDGLCLLSGLLLGPVYGGIAAGVGSALADFIGGYFVYIPATLIIKGAIAVIGCLLYRVFTKKGAKLLWALLPASVIAEVLTPVGYLVFELFLYGAGAVAGVPGNIAQAVAGVLVACLLYPIMKKAFEEVRHGN